MNQSTAGNVGQNGTARKENSSQGRQTAPVRGEKPSLLHAKYPIPSVLVYGILWHCLSTKGGYLVR